MNCCRYLIWPALYLMVNRCVYSAHKLCCAHVSQVRKIAGLMMEDTRSRVSGKGVQLVVGRRLMERIIRDGYSLEYGVRPLRQVSDSKQHRATLRRLM